MHDLKTILIFLKRLVSIMNLERESKVNGLLIDKEVFDQFRYLTKVAVWRIEFVDMKKKIVQGRMTRPK
ncbi:hypothetical protein PTTG_25813 [Puccinia triticina 1-1 BBBD Race 1]|uniref:Uncharacterized protein n=1 Tax=Puccinia triticina (isolate 1-1 / race 1 (BBBD)) TaxID=630390 RepID=A0A180H0J7_PUCT1|nr:hypothetical protein PTTG_25813 [Puccinia triticina 1-1 BBBD Race 1]